jgi:hypothetical protein
VAIPHCLTDRRPESHDVRDLRPSILYTATTAVTHRHRPICRPVRPSTCSIFHAVAIITRSIDRRAARTTALMLRIVIDRERAAWRPVRRRARDIPAPRGRRAPRAVPSAARVYAGNSCAPSARRRPQKASRGERRSPGTDARMDGCSSRRTPFPSKPRPAGAAATHGFARPHHMASPCSFGGWCWIGGGRKLERKSRCADQSSLLLLMMRGSEGTRATRCCVHIGISDGDRLSWASCYLMETHLWVSFCDSTR